MKVDFLTGKTAILTPPIRQKRNVIPGPVEGLALKHWEETTVPEPATMRTRKRSNIDEFVPQRLQTGTDKEQYENFWDQYGNEVRTIMANNSYLS